MAFLNSTYFVCQKKEKDAPVVSSSMSLLFSRGGASPVEFYEISLRRGGEKSVRSDEKIEKSDERVIRSVKRPSFPGFVREIPDSSDFICGAGARNEMFRVNSKTGNLVVQYNTSPKPSGAGGGRHGSLMFNQFKPVFDIEMMKKHDERFLTLFKHGNDFGIHHIDESEPLDTVVSTEILSSVKSSNFSPQKVLCGCQSLKLKIFDLHKKKEIFTTQGNDMNTFGLLNARMNPYMMMHFVPPAIVSESNRDGPQGISVLTEVDESRVLFGTGVALKLFDWKNEENVSNFNIGVGSGNFSILRNGCVYHDNKFMVVDTGGSSARLDFVMGRRTSAKLKMFDLRNPSEIVKTIEVAGDNDNMGLECSGISKIVDIYGNTRIITTWNERRPGVQASTSGLSLGGVNLFRRPLVPEEVGVHAVSRIYDFDGKMIKRIEEGKGRVTCLSVCRRRISSSVVEDRKQRVEFLSEEMINEDPKMFRKLKFSNGSETNCLKILM